jgi:hypothetical protein
MRPVAIPLLNMVFGVLVGKVTELWSRRHGERTVRCQPALGANWVWSTEAPQNWTAAISHLARDDNR